MRTHLLRRIWMTLAIILAFIDAAHADTCTWAFVSEPVTARDWGSTDYWDCGHVPGDADDVIIEGGPIVIDGDVVVASLTLNQLDGSRRLVVNGSITVKGNLTFECCTIARPVGDPPSGPGRMTVNGNLILPGSRGSVLSNMQVWVGAAVFLEKDSLSNAHLALFESTRLEHVGKLYITTDRGILGPTGSLISVDGIHKTRGKGVAWIEPRLEVNREVLVERGTLLLTGGSEDAPSVLREDLTVEREARIVFGERSRDGITDRPAHVALGRLDMNGPGSYDLEWGVLEVLDTVLGGGATLTLRNQEGNELRIEQGTSFLVHDTLNWMGGSIRSTHPDVQSFLAVSATGDKKGELRLSGRCHASAVTISNSGRITTDGGLIILSLEDGAELSNGYGGEIQVPGDLVVASRKHPHVPAVRNRGAVDIQGKVRFDGGTVNERAGDIRVSGRLETADQFINEGTIRGTGTVASLGRPIFNVGEVDPGLATPGRLDWQGDFQNQRFKTDLWSSDSAFKSGHSSASDAAENAHFDHLAITGNAVLEDTLEVYFHDDIRAGETFEILKANSVSGTFDHVVLPDGADVDVAYTPTSVVLTVVSATGAPTDAELPRRVALHQNYPNPFNPHTVIEYDLPAEVHVALRIVDVGGRVIATLVEDIRPPGRHSVVWDGRGGAGRYLASGVYYILLTAGDHREVRAMTLLR